ncbi:TPA: DNA topoisomerase, partial [Legionella pneumophila]
QSKKTKPPARFSEGTLIAAMKSIAKYIDETSLKKILKDTAGIGTEATRANILETLINREYVAKKGKQLISTKKGRALIELLPDSITNPATTAIWEQELDNIAEGKSDMNDFLEEQADTLEGMIEQLEKLSQSKGTIGTQTIYPCPDCNKPMTRRTGKKGYWWGCAGYPDCTMTAFDEKGKPKFLPKKEDSLTNSK